MITSVDYILYTDKSQGCSYRKNKNFRLGGIILRIDNEGKGNNPDVYISRDEEMFQLMEKKHADELSGEKVRFY